MYTYDALGQLTQVDYLQSHKRVEYVYGNGGNLSQEKTYDISGAEPVLENTVAYTYGDSSWGDLLTAYDNSSITYDSIGNPLQYRDGISFTWANGRQLQSYTKDNNTISYTYDSSGMRLTKDVGNTHYTYLYKNGLLAQETIGDSILDYSYTSGGQVISVRYKANANDVGTYYYYALNCRGDVIGLYDADGNVYAKYTYDVWGNPVSVTNASGVAISNPADIANIQSLRYRSYYYDSDTGFYYLQSRYYDPVTHRFVNLDGLVSTGTGVLGYNMFTYCDNNPVIHFDQFGQRWDEPGKEFCNLVHNYMTPSNTYGVVVGGCSITSAACSVAAKSFANSYVPPKNIGAGIARKSLANDLKNISAFEKGSSKLFKAMGYGVAVIDVGIGIYDNIQNNAPTEKIVLDATVDLAISGGSVVYGQQVQRAQL